MPAADVSQIVRAMSGLVSAAQRVEGQLKTLAHRRARAVQASAQNRAPVRTGLLRNSIVVIDQSAQRQFVVTVVDMTYRMPMLPVWIEFGTHDMPARPFLGPALEESRAAYLAEADELAATALQEALR